MTTPNRPRPRLTRDRVRALLATGMVVGLGAVGTMAVWTDQSTATSGQFTTGTVDIKLGSPAVENNPPAFTTDLSLANMAPGASKEAVLRVNNAGTLPFTYTLSSVATNNGGGANQLGAAMQLQVYAGATCSGTVINNPTKLDGTALTAPRSLAANSNESLCFKATLPAGANTALQGQSTVATFTLTATNS